MHLLKIKIYRRYIKEFLRINSCRKLILIYIEINFNFFIFLEVLTKKFVQTTVCLVDEPTL